MAIMLIKVIVRILASLCLLRYRDYYTLRCAALRVLAKGSGIRSRIMRRANDLFCERHGAYIPLEVEFDGPPCFPHRLFGIFISRGAHIGKNVVIFQQVTIGSNTLKDAGGSQGPAPIIEDNVFLGAGAKVIGGVRVGHNTRVGANCCVYRDVPPHSVCVSAPTRIIQKENLDNTFYFKEDTGTSRFFLNGQTHEDIK